MIFVLLIGGGYFQGCGSRSGKDPYLFDSLDPDPDPGVKIAPNFEKRIKKHSKKFSR
jgi:hypothetical protein